MRNELRDPRILSKIAEYYAMNMTYKAIAEKIAEDFNIDPPPKPQTIKRLIVLYQSKRNFLLQSDAQLREFYEQTIRNELEIWKEQLRKINRVANELLDYCNNLAQKAMETGEKLDRDLVNQLLASMDRILLQVKLATDILQKVESVSKEVSINIIEIIDKTKMVLKDLEKDGFVKILRPLEIQRNRPKTSEEDREEEIEEEGGYDED